MHNTTNEFDAGDHQVSLDGLEGYLAGSWGGDCNPDGTVTLTLGQDAVCTIINDDITPTLTVLKTIVNDNGGTIDNENVFGLQVDGDIVLHNATNVFDAGAHTVSEDGLPGYVPGLWGGDCNPDGSIILALDQDATCTITNDDTDSTSLTLVTQVINDNGGTASGSSWTLTATGPTGFSGSGPSVPNDPDFFAGQYDLSFSNGPAGYAGAAWVCVGGTQNDFDTITLGLGDAAICTVTLDDTTPTLTVIKTVVNDNGGTVTNLNAFGLRIDGDPVPHNVTTEVDAGSHIVSEDGLDGYAAGSWGGDCEPDGSITIALDQDVTCTITNDDISPSLKIVKTIINDNGGLIEDPDAFGLRLNGNIVLNNVVTVLDVGSYEVSEDGLPGYLPGPWGGDCEPDGSIILTLGKDAICTITNDDSDGSSLTLIKTVINNGGGTASASDWNLTAAGPSGFSGPGPIVSSGPDFIAGTYNLSESGDPPDYTASDWVCVGGNQEDGDTITLESGDIVECTITNDDDGFSDLMFENGFEQN